MHFQCEAHIGTYKKQDLTNRLESWPVLFFQAIMSSSTLSSTKLPSSFREIVERRAEDNGIIMMPVPNKTQEGKPVYKFGNVQIYIDRNVIFVYDDGRWIPKSLDRLMELATLPVM